VEPRKNNFHFKQRRHKPLQIMANRGRGGARGGLKRKPDGLDSVVADEPVGVSLERGPNKHPRSAEAASAKTCACALRSHGNVEEPSLSMIIEASAVSFQVLDDNGRLLDDETVSESKSAGNQGSRVGAGKKIAPVVPSQSGVCLLLAATSFDAKLLGSFGGFDCKTLSVLEDFFSTTIEHGDEDVARGLMNLAVGMRQAVYAYSTIANDLDVASERFEIAFNEKSIAENSFGQARVEITGLKVWVVLNFLCFLLLNRVAGVGSCA
jgi:hypothetical protein